MGVRAIEAALYAQLETLLTTASPAGSVVNVVRTVGDERSALKIEQQALTGDNAVAIAHESSRPLPKEGVTTLVGGSSRTMLLTRFRVRVMVRDQRSFDDALATASTGLYALVDAVRACLDGFDCTGIAPNTRVKYAGDRSSTHQPGRYLATLYFEARHPEDAADNTDASTTPFDVCSDVNLEGKDDTEPNPVDQVKVTMT